MQPTPNDGNAPPPPRPPYASFPPGGSMPQQRPFFPQGFQFPVMMPPQAYLYGPPHGFPHQAMVSRQPPRCTPFMQQPPSNSETASNPPSGGPPPGHPNMMRHHSVMPAPSHMKIPPGTTPFGPHFRMMPPGAGRGAPHGAMLQGMVRTPYSPYDANDPAAAYKMSSLKCAPSQLRNGRPLFMEVLYMCNQIYTTYNQSEKTICPVTPLRLANGLKKIFCRPASIRTLPFETISPISRLFGVQELKWLPCRIAYPRPEGGTPTEETQQEDKSTDEEKASNIPNFPSFPRPRIGRASFYIEGPMQMPETTKTYGTPVDPSDERWNWPLWSFYAHLTVEDAWPVAQSLLSFIDDVSFCRLRATGQETRKWLDYWHTARVADRYRLDFEKKPATEASTLMSNCLLQAPSYGDHTPWVRIADLEYFERINEVGGSKATQSAYVQQFRAPSANFVRMCIATMEPGGVFSMLPLDKESASSSSSYYSSQSHQSNNDKDTKEDNSSLSPNVLSVSDSTIFALRSKLALYPRVKIGDENQWKVWTPSCGGAEIVIRLFNCWRQSVARIVSIYRRKVWALWYHHDLLHQNRLLKPAVKDDSLVKEKSGSSAGDLSTMATLPEKEESKQAEKKTCCSNPMAPSVLGKDYLDWFASTPEDASNLPDTLFLGNSRQHGNSSFAPHPSLLNPHHVGLIPHQNHGRRAETKKRSDRRAETDLEQNSIEEAHENLFKHFGEDLVAPYTRPNCSPADVKKDILLQSILAYQQRIEWDIVCLLSLYVQFLESDPEENIPLKTQLEGMISCLKIDRFMTLILQGRMHQIKNRIKDEFDPSVHSLESILQGEQYRPRGNEDPDDIAFLALESGGRRKRPPSKNDRIVEGLDLRSWAIRRHKTTKGRDPLQRMETKKRKES